MRLKLVALILSLALGLLAVALPTEAPKAETIYRIGLLYPGAGKHIRAQLEDFRRGLAELGWREGQNIAIEYRFAEGKFSRLADFAAEMVRRKADVIVAATTPSAKAAKNATSTVPVVFLVVSDPIADGLVTSLARPGGNITGLTIVLPELSGKLVEFLKETVPTLSRAAVLWNPDNPGKRHEWRETQAAARRHGVELRSLEVRSPEDLEPAFAVITEERPDGLITFADSLTWTHRQRIADFAAMSRLPAIYQLPQYVTAGGLMAYAPDLKDHWRRAGVYAGRILKGVRPADLPVERPTRYVLIINLKAAKALGLTFPDSILLRADRVIK